jgi:hypothetical protein
VGRNLDKAKDPMTVVLTKERAFGHNPRSEGGSNQGFSLFLLVI